MTKGMSGVDWFILLSLLAVSSMVVGRLWMWVRAPYVIPPCPPLTEGLGIPRSTYAFWRTRAAAGALDPRQPGRPPTESTRSRQLDRALGPVKEQLGRIIDILTEGE